MTKRKGRITRGDETPYYAYFKHSDGSWYTLWMTKSEPSTERGHPWHVHANLDKQGAMTPVLDGEWYNNPYGTYNWDFDTEEEAIEHFLTERYLPRLERGYKLMSGHIPADWPTK